MSEIFKKALKTTTDNYFSILGVFLTLMLASFLMSIVTGIFNSMPMVKMGLTIVTSIINAYFGLGVTCLILKMVRKKDYEFSDMFIPLQKFLKYVPAYLLVLFGAIVIFLPFIMSIGHAAFIALFTNPDGLELINLEISTVSKIMLGCAILIFLFFAIRIMFFQYFFLEEDITGIFALTETFKATKEHFFHILALLLVLILLNIVGMVLLFVGLLFTIPLSLCLIAHYYAEYIHPGNEEAEIIIHDEH